MTTLEHLTAALRSRRDPDKKAWWERYLKGAIEFYGVPMAEIRAVVRTWAQSEPDLDTVRAAALELLSYEIAEEKLAGILLMQEVLAPAGHLAADRDLPALAVRFDDGSIADWNTTDWLCVRVIGPLVAAEGEPAADLLTRWTDAPGVWRRRAAVVGFVPLVTKGNTTLPGLPARIIRMCETLSPNAERFIQTGIGWILRELSDTDADRVFRFLSDHQTQLSREALRMGAARLPDELRASLGITGKRRRR